MQGILSAKRGVINVLLAACAVLILTACGTIVATPPAASIDAPMTAGTRDAYVMQPGDAVRLSVYGEETITGDYRIDRNGMLTVPLAGEIRASGATREELQDDIAASLKSGGYLSKPLVSVDIVAMRPFFILGEVNTPGTYPYMPSLDVFKAIATAGGYTPRAAKNMILIDRGEGSRRQHMNANENTPVLPGDSITVRERIF